MSPRHYALKRRAEAAEETRRRIVAATMALHTEQGIVATSHKDIAARADVSVGTVYHHFPTLDSIVRACGQRIREEIPVPSAAVIDTSAPRRQRVAALVRALVDFYIRMPWLEKLRGERHQVPALDLGMTMREEAIRQLIRRAIGRRTAAKKIAVAQAILDPAVVNRLLQSGISQKEAAATLTSILNAWLEGGHS